VVQAMGAPVVADDHRRLVRAQGGDQASHISGQMFETIGLDLVGLVRAAVAANRTKKSRQIMPRGLPL
jgi:hypothetical protein